MRRIYEPENLLEAQMLLGMLASEGVTAHLAGSHLLGAIGELPVSGLLGLLVADEQVGRAIELIAAYNAALPLPSDFIVDSEGSLLC
jgi:hypothetical protein